MSTPGGGGLDRGLVGGPDAAEPQALADALSAEHAAVYAYGVVAARVRTARSTAVGAAWQEHLRRRDELVSVLTAAGAVVPVPAPGYTLPVEVSDAETAVALALAVEESTAVAWRSVLERSAPGSPAVVVATTTPAAKPTTAPTTRTTAPTPSPSAVPQAPYAVRAAAVAALVDCAGRASAWRGVLGTSPVTTAFPGEPTPG